MGLNFTLPPMEITASTMPSILRQYRDIIQGALQRAADLDSEGVVIEFETLPPMTEHPEWGLSIVKVLRDGMEQFSGSHGLKSVLRVTPNDNREFVRPPVMRSGYHLEKMLELFEGAAAEGAELLSIESVGGKELHDDALVSGDIAAVIFALCCAGVRDMRFLWTTISEIASRHGVHAAGDTACGFGNQAILGGGHDIASYQKWVVASDAKHDPQAYILSPENSIRIAKAIVSQPNHYLAGRAAALEAVAMLREGLAAQRVHIRTNEQSWLDIIEQAVESMPDDEGDFIAERLDEVDPSLFRADQYGL